MVSPALESPFRGMAGTPPRSMLKAPAPPSSPRHRVARLQLTQAGFAPSRASRDTPRMRVGRCEVNISNPDKVFFPERGLTKGDLVAYYVDVAACALHHLRRRPFHMKRYPNGVDGDFFHQKRVPRHPEYVGGQFVQFPSGHSTVFAVVD